LRATIDNFIRIPLEDLDDDLWEKLAPELQLTNHAKLEAKKGRRYGWQDMPDVIEVWDTEDNHLIIPRGMLDPLRHGFKELDIPVEWEDRRSSDKIHGVWPPFDQYRSFQRPAAQRLIECQEGIVEAPAGSGKSVMGLEVIRRARERWNLVIVNEIGIARQWLAEAEDFLGPDFGYGIIGGGEWSEGRLTLATVQTLYAKLKDGTLDPQWCAKWGVVLLDECHHQTADTFIQVMQLFSARVRGGLSATPNKTGDFEAAQAVLGDVIHRTTRFELREEGILIRPTIEMVDTGFDYEYWPDHEATKAHEYECLKPGCPLSGKRRHGHRNNYQKMLSALVHDDSRNNIIAHKIQGRVGHPQIVVSKQTNQLMQIRKAMEALGAGYSADFDTKVLMLTGNEDDYQRQQVKRDIMEIGNVVLLTTIADEAFNAPPLDTLHMPFPTKNVGAIRQRVGRIERAWPDKLDAVGYDYIDLPGPFRSQARTRRWEVYAVERYTVIRNGQEESDGV
jgi:superfamily II DNA or RNA helicase